MNNNDTLPSLTHADLQQFMGDEVRFRHPLNRQVIYTPGVQFLAGRGEAYWLIDAIASYFGDKLMTEAQARDDRLNWMRFWRLDVKPDNTATLTARADDGVAPFITQEIEYTDFPLDYVDIWAGYDTQNWTLYLPSEH